jgi:hypothetical protein
MIRGCLEIIEKWVEENRLQPMDCDVDHTYGRNHPATNGLFSLTSVGHRKNAMRSHVRKKSKDWCYGAFGGPYTNGKISLISCP